MEGLNPAKDRTWKNGCGQGQGRWLGGRGSLGLRPEFLPGGPKANLHLRFSVVHIGRATSPHGSKHSLSLKEWTLEPDSEISHM